MNRSRIFLFSVLLFSFAGTLLGQEPAVRPETKIELFNGRDLTNFYTWLVDDHYEDPLRVFTVVDQVDGAPALRVSGEKWGAFVTRDRFRDYRLVVEFRWGPTTWGNRKNRTRDSGVLVHCRGRDGNTGEDFNGPWMRSVEAQIIEGGIGDFILVGGYTADGLREVPAGKARVARDRDGEPYYDPWSELVDFEGGRINWFGRDPDWTDRLGFRGKRDVESPYGEWTRLEVVCRGDEVTNYVNGQVVNRLRESSFTEGKIMFQSEGAEIYFRRIDLEPLD